jgi:hypothetical protein
VSPPYLLSCLLGASRHPRFLPLHWLFFTFFVVLVGYSAWLFGCIYILRLSNVSWYPRLVSLVGCFSSFWLFYWAIAYDFSAVFSKMGWTFAQKLWFWCSIFSWKIISKPMRNNQQDFMLLPTFQPKIRSQSTMFWCFLESKGPWMARAIRCCVVHLNLSS